jgi:hypothetical protein
MRAGRDPGGGRGPYALHSAHQRRHGAERRRSGPRVSVVGTGASELHMHVRDQDGLESLKLEHGRPAFSCKML